MTITLITAICILLILAYIFDITSSKTKIPSVIMLLVLGWIVNQISTFIDVPIPDLTPILPILGTVGLILIVLEGSLELELNKSKFSFVRKTSLIAILPMLILSFLLGYCFHYFGNTSLKIGLANAIPFAIISSAIAIPSAQNLRSKQKAFVTYESSLSDIFGVIIFNFITINEIIGFQSIKHFLIQLVIILVITVIATLGLAFLLSKIKHHVKFAPIILIIVLIYDISKIYHLPALIFILLFGLFLGNLDEIKHNKFIQKLQPEILNKEVCKFKELTIEIAFLVRSLFFLLFGYLIQTSELFNSQTILWAICITFGIFFFRYVFLKIFKLKLDPLLYIAPRGLITILLFLSIPQNQVTALANKSLIIQVIILTALVMMIGLMANNNGKKIRAVI
ncbi:cation:proton antiporter [Flavobacterium cellulosilyticum]|uniref:Sodium:proton antiporter n=1 Tax=Flavobacterium cellulosilyticum TaxID=2541731 RepID=A0A4R5CG51_9FLAO|nr:cation:proton antiporter [Flavobacterium cellulosilyticum]TDD98019.1 sodium:proton antiporter [Flavobacterium cellulosilyticum]